MKKIVLIVSIFLFLILLLGNVLAASQFLRLERDPFWTRNFSLYKDFWTSSPIWNISEEFIYPADLSKNVLIGGTDSDSFVFRFRPDKGKLVIDTSAADGEGTSLKIIAGDITASSCVNILNLPMSVDMETGKAFQVMLKDEVKARGMIYSDGAYCIGDGTHMRDICISRGGIKTLLISNDKIGGKANLNITGDLIVDFADLFVNSELGRVGIGTNTPQNTLNVIGATNSTAGFITGEYTGISDNSSYWLCTTKDCDSTCQVNIQGGLIVGCN